MTLPLSPTLSDRMPPCRAVALLVDGQNVAATLAGRAITQARSLGPLTVLRVYGDARSLGDWHTAPGFRVVHAHAGKNVTDMLMTVEAMELGLTGAVDGIALASNDRDFAPLAQALKARGLPVLGLLGPCAPDAFAKSCSRTLPLTAEPPDPLRAAALSILRGQSLSPQAFGVAMTRLGHAKPKGVARWETYLRGLADSVTITGEGVDKRFSALG